jgi:O-antigen ligase
MDIKYILLFLITLLIQFANGQIVATSILFLWVFVSIVKIIKKKHIELKILFWFYIWFFLIVFLLRSPYLHFTETHYEVFWLSIGLLSFIIAANSKLDRVKSIVTTITSGLIVGLLNIYAYYTSSTLGGILNPPYAGTRAVGGFDGPNEMGAYYLLILSLCLGLLLTVKSKKIKFLCFFTVLVMLPVIYTTYSRGALLGLCLMLVIFSITLIIKTNIKRKVFTVALVVLSSVFVYNLFIKFFLPNFQTIRHNAGSRTYLLEEVLNMFYKKPIFGWGLGAFGVETSITNEVPHSDFFVFMVSGGIIGLLFLVMFFLYFIYISYRNKLTPELFFLISYCSQAFTFNHLIRGRVSFIFWLMIMIILVYSLNEKSNSLDCTETHQVNSGGKLFV